MLARFSMCDIFCLVVINRYFCFMFFIFILLGLVLVFFEYCKE